MPYSDQDYGSSGGGLPVRATVKWFNDSKGFGFVVPEGRDVDAFLHATVLRRLGMESLGEGAQIVCTIGAGPKGPQVDSVLEVLSRGNSGGSGGQRSPSSSSGGGRYGSGGGYGHGGYGNRSRDEGGYGGYGGAPRQSSRSNSGHGAPSGPIETLGGTVKWYKPEKGFGFIVPDDGDRDVFVHKSCLDRAGLGGLTTGQRVRIGVRTVPKGREVAELEIER